MGQIQRETNMADAIEFAKKHVLDWQNSSDNACIDTIHACFAKFMSDTYHWYGMHPFNEQHDSDSVIKNFYRPFNTAFTSIQRRQDIFLRAVTK